MPPPQRRRLAMQAKHKDQDTDLATKYSCSNCRIVYYAAAATCPLCDAHSQMQEMRRALNEARTKLEAVTNANQRLKEAVDIGTAIRSASELLDDNDMVFLKTVLYQWKIDRSVKMKLTHEGALETGVSAANPAFSRKGRGSPKRYDQLHPNGFLAVYPDQDPAAHTCTSMGGLAIAEYYEEALHTVGMEPAMQLLLRGLAKLMPGAMQ